MTYREKYMSDFPNTTLNPRFSCPSMFGYEPEGNCANPERDSDVEKVCNACWDREMPDCISPSAAFHQGVVDGIEHSHILDSGERQKFSTGAERDIQKGKGLFDLVPLKVAARIFGAPYIQPEDGYVDPVLWCIGHYQDTVDTCWIYTALAFIAERVFPVGNDRQASIANMLLEVAIHFEEGARKYKPNNWKKGIPVERYIDSGTRHYMKWLRGDKDEPHNRAAAWNLICLAWEADFSPRAKGEGMPVTEEAPAHEVNSGRFYICNRKPCEVCHSDCHCTEVLNNTAVLELSDRDVRYEDCPIGLFMCDSDGVFLKTELVDAETGLNTAIHIGLGLSRKFKADDLVCPIKYPFEERERV